jgi:hypothetical protein
MNTNPNNEGMNEMQLHDDIEQQNGMPVLFYAERLSDEDFDTVLNHAMFCLMGKHKAHKLAYYISAIVTFEGERRKLLDEYPGGELLECVLPPLPCDKWSNIEVAVALGKITSICATVGGEPYELFKRLHQVILVESQWRLGLTD